MLVVKALLLTQQMIHCSCLAKLNCLVLQHIQWPVKVHNIQYLRITIVELRNKETLVRPALGGSALRVRAILPPSVMSTLVVRLTAPTLAPLLACASASAFNHISNNLRPSVADRKGVSICQ